MTSAEDLLLRPRLFPCLRRRHRMHENTFNSIMQCNFERSGVAQAQKYEPDGQASPPSLPWPFIIQKTFATSRVPDFEFQLSECTNIEISSSSGLFPKLTNPQRESGRQLPQKMFAKSTLLTSLGAFRKEKRRCCIATCLGFVAQS